MPERRQPRRPMPEEERNDPLLRELAGYRCDTRMHVVRLLSPRLDNESHTKDIDFSADGIGRRWQAGYDYVRRAIEQQPWYCDVDALSGVLIHEVHQGPMVVEHA